MSGNGVVWKYQCKKVFLCNKISGFLFITVFKLGPVPFGTDYLVSPVLLKVQIENVAIICF